LHNCKFNLDNTGSAAVIRLDYRIVTDILETLKEYNVATQNGVNLGLSSSTGTGNFVGSNTPTLITPVLGAATGTSLVTSGSITAGLVAGGSPGTLISFPTTTSKGKLVVAAVDNATGAFDTTISNSTAVAQSQVVSIPDSGAATAKFILSTGAGQTIGNGLTLTTPVIGAASATSLSFSSTSGIIGTTTNDAAAAGSVGQYIDATQGDSTSITSAVETNITSISLTAGDWDVWGQVNFYPAASTTVTYIAASISQTSATVDGTVGNLVLLSYGGQVVQTYANHTDCLVGPIRISLSGTTTIYLVGSTIFATSTMQTQGTIRARRVR
jgi:hypothetical protein